MAKGRAESAEEAAQEKQIMAERWLMHTAAAGA